MYFYGENEVFDIVQIEQRIQFCKERLREGIEKRNLINIGNIK